MRSLLLFLFIFCVSGFLFSQVNILQIPRIPQKDPTWCWASSILMGSLYRGSPSTLSQCSIRQALSSCNSCPDNCLNSDNCSRTLYVKDIKPILKYLGYNSTKYSSTLGWSQVKLQIDGNLPLIIGITNSDCVSGNSAVHIVLAKGYEEFKKDGVLYQYIYVNDPFCNAIICKVRYNSSVGIRPCGFIYNIKKPNEIVTGIAVNKTLPNCATAIDKRISQFSLDSLIRNGYQVTNVKYSDSSNINNIQTIDLSSTQKDSSKFTSVTRFQKVGDYWEPALIFTQIDEPNIRIKRVNSKDIILSNDRNLSDDSAIIVPYEKYVSSSLPFEFYKFIFQGNEYLTPANIDNNYFIGKNKIQKNRIYEIKTIETYLNKYVTNINFNLMSDLDSDKFNSDKLDSDKLNSDKLDSDKLNSDKLDSDKLNSDKLNTDKLNTDKLNLNAKFNFKNRVIKNN